MANASWKTIAADLSRRIESGELIPGARVPSGEDLALQWSVSRHTAHRAIEELQREGLVIRQRRWGTVVAERNRKKTGRIAFVVDRLVQMVNFPPSDMIRGLHDVFGDDFTIQISECRSDWEIEARQMRKLRGDVDGVILFPTSDPHNTPLLQSMFDGGLPLVVLDRFPDGLHVDSVVSDNEEATLRAIRTLEARGHRRIGFFSFHKPDFSSVTERHGAYVAALAEVGVDDPGPFTRWFHRDLESEPQMFVQAVHDALFTLLRQDQPLTALFCVEDAVASAVLQSCERLGISVPDQLEVATFNDWPPMMLRTPWCTHRIVQRPYDIGRTAAELLLQRMRGELDVPVLRRVSADFFVADAGIEPPPTQPNSPTKSTNPRPTEV